MKEKIVGYLENTLPPTEKRAFERALEQDVSLRKAYHFQKEHWEKFELLRYHAQAGELLRQAKVAEAKYVGGLSVLSIQSIALAAGVLLFAFNFNSLLQWFKGDVPLSQPPEIVDKSQPPKIVDSVANAVVVTPKKSEPVVKAKEPKRVAPKAKPAPLPKPETELQSATNFVAQTAPPVEPTTKVGAMDKDDPIFIFTKPALAERIDNLKDFNGDSSLIIKQLSSIDCGYFSLSFIIEADGNISDPKYERGEASCENRVMEQITSLPMLPKPMLEGKAVRYRYTYHHPNPTSKK